MPKVLILYTQKPKILQFLPELEKKLTICNIKHQSYIIHPSSQIQAKELLSIKEQLPYTDFIICLGGDGTVLSAAQLLYKYPIPILPINFGQLGFIAESTQAEEIDTFLEEILNQTILKETRTLLDISLLGTEIKNKLHWTALNEVYVGSNIYHKVGDFCVEVDGFSLSQYKADGLLVSTATGSTGYNLSAGGPILYPSLDVFVLTSVVPHKLSHRPLVLSSSSKIEICVKNEFSQNLVIDGQHKVEIQPQNKIIIQKSAHSLILMYSSQRNYFQALKEKLNWMV